MSKTKEELSDETLVHPTMGSCIDILKDESLMLFSYAWRNKKRYRLFYGIGKVYRVVKGEKQDLIYVNFGAFKENKRRIVIAYENHARRQVMTLKRGQVCQVYGICRYFTTKIKLNGLETKGIKLGLYAIAINGWYVPTMFDIRKMPTNDDLVEPTEKEENLMETFEDVLDQFLKGDEDL